MKELIISKHSKKHPPLVTQERNLQREPIDGIFTTPGIKGIEAGYLGFKESGKYDYQALWVDLSYKEALGFTHNVNTIQTMTRLTTKLPSRVDKYNSLVKEKMTNHGLFKKMDNLKEASSTSKWNKEMEKNFNDIQRQQTIIRKTIEKKIRKLRVRNVPWSPKIQNLRNNITLAELLWKKSNKGKVSSKRILELRQLTGKWETNKLSKEELEIESKRAYEKYRVVKKNEAKDLRDSFLDLHAKELARKNGTKIEIEKKKL